MMMMMMMKDLCVGWGRDAAEVLNLLVECDRGIGDLDSVEG